MDGVFDGVGIATAANPTTVTIAGDLVTTGDVAVGRVISGVLNDVAFGDETNFDLSRSNFHTLVLTGDTTATFTNRVVADYTFRIVQDAVGGRQISTWSGNWCFPGGVAPALTVAANAVDILRFWCDGTNMHLISITNDSR